jgi:hypothetical protein
LINVLFPLLGPLCPCLGICVESETNTTTRAAPLVLWGRLHRVNGCPVMVVTLMVIVTVALMVVSDHDGIEREGGGGRERGGWGGWEVVDKQESNVVSR